MAYSEVRVASGRSDQTHSVPRQTNRTCR